MNISVNASEIIDMNFSNPKYHHNWISFQCGNQDKHVNDFSIFFNDIPELENFICQINHHLSNIKRSHNEHYNDSSGK